MKIAFIVDSFPKLSETFILDQVTGLLDLGHDVRIFPAWPRQPQHAVHDDVEKYALMERVSYIPPTPKNKLLRLLIALRLIICDFFLRPIPDVPATDGPFRTIAAAGFMAHPIRTFRLLCMALASPRDVSLRLLYFLSRFSVGDFDIVHCHYGHNGILGLELRRIGALPPKTKIVTTFHGYDEHILPPLVLRSRYARLFRDGDLFTANTAFTKQKIVTLGADPAKVQVLPVGLHMDKFASPPPRQEPARPVQILTVARLVEKKGLTYAIEAVSMLKDKSNVKYSIVGDGPLRDQLQEKVKGLGLSNIVSFLGPLDQQSVLKLYSQADIFLLPSVTASDGEMEGQGLVLQEAQACGIPVISTFHNGIPDGLIDGQTGILVPEKDAGAIAAVLDRLIGDPEMRLKFGAAGRLFVKDRYDIRKLNARLEQIYRSLLS